MRSAKQLSAQRRAALLRQSHEARCCASCGYPVTADGLGWRCTVCNYHFIAVPVTEVKVTEHVAVAGATHTDFSLTVNLAVPNGSPGLGAVIAQADESYSSRHGDL